MGQLMMDKPQTWIVIFKDNATPEQIDQYMDMIKSRGGSIVQVYTDLFKGFAASMSQSLASSLQSFMPGVIDYIVFPVDRSLLNPKFDGYKLHNLDDSLTLQQHPLPGQGATQSTITTRATTITLSFEEFQSRVKHNHLSPGLNEGELAYIDAGRNLVLVRCDPDTAEVTFRTVFEIPEAIKTVGVTANESPNEYPVAIALTQDIWLVSDGQQSLHLVKITDNGDGTSKGTCVSSYEYLAPDRSGSVPSLRLHSARLQDGRIVAILSHRVSIEIPSTSPTISRARPTSKTVFDVIGASLQFSGSQSSSTTAVEVRWKARGDSVPILVAHSEKRKAYLLLGGTSYSLDGQDAPTPYEPSADEIAPIPRLGENLDGHKQTNDIPKPPPYSWTQTEDSVTIAFPLPSSTPASAIRVIIGARHLTLVANVPESEASIFPIPIPRYLQKDWWAEVDASSSFWTWDKEGERQKGETGVNTVGLLSLHLEKRHAGTRWPHVFHAVGTQVGPDVKPEDIEVPETLDPSELWHIRESLEKYTSALSEGRDVGGLGLGSGMPSLGQGEFDEEVDAAAGTPVVLTWIDDSGAQNQWDGKPWPAEAVLLSRPLPSPQRSAEDLARLPALVIKNDIDGVVFNPPRGLLESEGVQVDQDEKPKSHPGNLEWVHTSTFSALSFVLASKRDLRFVYHIGTKVVLAFEGNRGDAGENVYIYRATATNTARTADQAIIRIGGGTAGTLLGACGIMGPDGRSRVVCLCEKQLVVLPEIA
ncbi:hypothetical protein FRB99_001180 [Tulasnella sp. 403]|nr:hypothetical protein FRB99_001180 [Tulasnella sp. 403]